MYAVQGETLEFILNSTFFEGNGWKAPQPRYKAWFFPATSWASKKRGEVYMQFEGDTKRTKVLINNLTAHGIELLSPFPVESSSDDSDDGVDPKDPDHAPAARKDIDSDSSSPPKTPKNPPAPRDPNKTQTPLAGTRMPSAL